MKKYVRRLNKNYVVCLGNYLQVDITAKTFTQNGSRSTVRVTKEFFKTTRSRFTFK